MDLTLYGICFKMRGTLDLLDYVQSETPMPVEVMQQVMDQMGSVTKEELDFARKLKDDWKKAFNERVPMTMVVADDGGYEITCSVPDELLDTVRLLTGLEPGRIVEEHTTEYLKNVCGIDASIISVDVEGCRKANIHAEGPENAQGFDIGDLDAAPEGPVFEDVAAFGDIGDELEKASREIPAEQEPMLEEDVPEETFMEEPVMEEPVLDEEPAMDEEPVPEEEPVPDEEPAILDEEPEPEEPVFEEPEPEEPAFEEPEPEEPAFEEPEPGEDGYPKEEELYGGEPYGDEDYEDDHNAAMQGAMTDIYRELVGNIRDRKLDERLGLQIGRPSV